MSIQACANIADLTCEQKEALEVAGATELWNKFCGGDASMSQLLQLFIFPPWTTDPTDQAIQLARMLTIAEICNPTNHAETTCVDCDDPVRTGCPDTEACASKFVGYGLLEVLLAARRADSIAYLPVANFADIAPGEALVWDPTANAENPDCDPCTPNPVGALVPQHLYELAHPD